MKRKLYIITYDIVDDRMRSRVAEIIKDYGHRVQKSVFEVCVGPLQVKELKTKLIAEIDEEEDSIIIYPLCEACVKQRMEMGITIVRANETVRII